MNSLPLIFIAGALASAHCIGMCGPIALAIGSGTPSWKTNLVRQSFYTCGRLITYAVFGVAAGAAGLYLQQRSAAIVNAAAVLAIVAGLFLLYQGLRAAGVIARRQRASTAHGPCLTNAFIGEFLRSPRMPNVFLAGLFSGMLPCGLVYGFVALAASSSDPLAGAGLMVAFGLGTAPVMMLTGCGGYLLNVAARTSIYRIAAWCVVATGLISIARGAGFVDLFGWGAPGCPLCP